MSEQRGPYLYEVHMVVAAEPETWSQHEVIAALSSGPRRQYAELDCGHVIPGSHAKGDRVGCPLCAYLEERAPNGTVRPAHGAGLVP